MLGGCARRAAYDGASGGPITINFWNGFTGPDGKTMDAIVQNFMRENPDVVVKTQTIPWGTYYDKLTLGFAYGGAPDVFIMPAARLPEFASFDALRPLDDLRPAPRPEEFAPIPWRASFAKGHLVALPLDVHPFGLYYNTKLFREAGIAHPPTNWDEFLADAQKLTKDTDKDGRPDQWGFVFTNQRSNFLTFSHQWGGDVLTPDNKRGAMFSPANLKATGQMHDLIYRYKVAPRPEGVDAWLAFRQGKVGMALEGIYMLTGLEEQKGLEFAGAPVPQFGPKRAIWGGSHLLAMPRGISETRARAGWRLMRFLSEHSFAWAKGGQVPARLAVEQSPQFAALPVQAQFARQLDIVQYEVPMPRANALFPFVDPAVEAILLDLQTPEAALRDADRRINQVLERP